MSAWVVSKEHIDAMLRVALVDQRRGAGPLRWGKLGEDRQLDCYSANEAGQMLVMENVKSVCYRYNAVATAPNLPGPVRHYWDAPYKYPLFVGRTPTAVEGFKLLDCYEYQSCEHPEWPESEAYAFCQALRRRLSVQLPGYDEAPWGWGDWLMP